MQALRGVCVLAVLCLAACEQEIVVDVKVTVPAEVQALYSKQAPGRLMVGMDIPKSSVGWYSLGILCDPTTQPLVATLHHEGLGCAKEGTVRAWVVPVPEPSAVQCGLATKSHNDAPAPTATSVQGSGVIFSGETGDTGCSSGKGQVEIVLSKP